MTEMTMVVTRSGCNSTYNEKDGGKSHARGWRMLLSLGVCFLLLLLLCLPAIGQEETQSVADAARAARAKRTPPSSSNPGRVGQPPVAASQLVAWQVAGLPAGDIVNEMNARGIAFAPDRAQLDALNQAQVAPEVVAALSKAATHPGTNDSGEIPPALVTGSQAFHANDYRSALHALDGLAQQNQKADLYAAIGNLQDLAKNLAQAKIAFQKAVQLDPSFAYAHVRLAGIYYKLEDKPNMMMEAKTALQLQPGNAEARKYVALAYTMDSSGASGASSMDVDAGADVEDLSDLTIGDKSPEALKVNNQAIELEHQYNYVAAEQAYQKAISIAPDIAAIHYNLGHFYGHWPGHTEQALAEYRTAKRLAPKNLAIRQNLGHTLCESGRWSEAVTEFQDLLRMDPTWNMARPCLENSLNHLGRTAEADQVAKDYKKYGGGDEDNSPSPNPKSAKPLPPPPPGVHL